MCKPVSQHAAFECIGQVLTICTYINFLGMYMLWMPSEWGVLRISLMRSPILPDDFAISVCNHCSITHAATGGVPVHLACDMSSFHHFGETLLTPSWVVDTSTIYLCRYAVTMFVAITCINKSGWLQYETFCCTNGRIETAKTLTGDSCERRSHVGHVVHNV